MLLFLDDSQTQLRAHRARLVDHASVRLHASRLDHDLAEGASPDSSVALALRAGALVRPGARRQLVRSLERLVAVAEDPSLPRRVRAPICADRVREASAEFRILIEQLLRPGPVSVRGVAQLRILLSDGSAPHHHRGNLDDLNARLRRIVEALDPLVSSWGTWLV